MTFVSGKSLMPYLPSQPELLERHCPGENTEEGLSNFCTVLERICQSGDDLSVLRNEKYLLLRQAEDPCRGWLSVRQLRLTWNQHPFTAF